MSMHRSLVAGLWLLAAAGAYAVVGAAWADAARSGKLPPWTLVVLFWGTALVSVTIHHLSRYLAGHLADAPDTLSRYGMRWRLAARLQARRIGRLLLPGRPADQAMALRIVPLQAPAAGGTAPAGEAPPSWTLIVVLRSVAGVWAATHGLSHWLARGQDALRRGWRQLGPAVGRYVGSCVSKVRLLRAAGGHSVGLAARLGTLIGVR